MMCERPFISRQRRPASDSTPHSIFSQVGECTQILGRMPGCSGRRRRCRRWLSGCKSSEYAPCKWWFGAFARCCTVYPFLCKKCNPSYVLFGCIQCILPRTSRPRLPQNTNCAAKSGLRLSTASKSADTSWQLNDDHGRQSNASKIWSEVCMGSCSRLFAECSCTSLGGKDKGKGCKWRPVWRRITEWKKHGSTMKHRNLLCGRTACS